jgi:succinate dehydrogenase/fumarate reductase flavoprotein subunit
LVRQESRGAHTRLDFEGEHDEWGKVNVVVRKKPDGSMGVSKVERGTPPDHLAAIAYSSLDSWEGGVHV